MLTCTDVEQQWGGLKERTMSKFDPVPLKDFCHISTQKPPYKREIKEVTAEMGCQFLSMFLEGIYKCVSADKLTSSSFQFLLELMLKF